MKIDIVKVNLDNREVYLVILKVKVNLDNREVYWVYIGSVNLDNI